jgi:NAD(P)-dependent dehydrogenase (short-subunit alcohol dehydrogenase family)
MSNAPGAQSTLAPRVVVVTGGTRGIGRAIVSRFAHAGDTVVTFARDAATIAEGDVRSEQCDITDEATVRATFESVGAVDVLVNNAGASESASLARTPLESWERQYAVNATGAFLCTRAVLPTMIERGTGRIVTVASTAARIGYRYASGYVASKHAAVGLMRSVAAEVAGTGVTANAVCPTFVRTEMTAQSIARIVEATGRSERDSERALAESSPLRRLLEPEEVAAAVVFLASHDARSINGQTIVLDGGGIQA